MMRALICFSAAALTGFSAAAAVSDADAEAIARARAELSRRIEAAEAGGAVAVRGAPQERLMPSDPPDLRDADLSGCLTLPMLTRTEAGLGPDKAQALDRLRAGLLSEKAENRVGAELLLARAYLVIGFAEEAYAIAAARRGAEAAAIAGLAALAGAADQHDFAEVAQHKACGALYAFIFDAAKILGGADVELSDALRSTLSALPSPLRQRIAEAFAVTVPRADETAAKPALATVEGGAAFGSRRLVNAAMDRSEAGAPALAAFGAASASGGAPKLNALGPRLDAVVPAATTAASNAGAVQDVDRAPLSASTSALNIALAERRIAHRDFRGAARALGAAAHHQRARAGATARFGAMTAPLLRSKTSSDRLAALEAIALEPTLAAESLTAEDVRFAAAALADLGAEESLAKVISAASLEAGDHAYFKSRALGQAGRIAEARALAAPNAEDPRVAQMLLQTAYSEADAQELKEKAPPSAEPSVLSAAYWRVGDFPALMALAHTNPADAATAQRVALAFLAARKTPQKPLMSADQSGAVAALFMSVPTKAVADPHEIERLTQYRKSEIAFLRAAVNNE